MIAACLILAGLAALAWAITAAESPAKGLGALPLVFESNEAQMALGNNKSA
jgi:hypothetical protein